MHNDVVRFVMDNHLPGLLGYPFLGGLFGALGGALLALVVFFFVRALGAYRLEIKGAVGLRILVAMLLIVAGGICGGIAGFHEGIWRGVERVAQRGTADDTLLPQAGRSGALFMARIYLMSPSTAASEIDDPALQAQLATFGTGKWELNVNELQQRMRNVPVHAINAAIAAVSQETTLRFPALKNSRAEQLIFGFLERLGESMLPQGIQDAGEQARDSELVRACAAIWRGLPAEAAKHGNADTISCTQLSAYLARHSLHALLLNPLRHTMRTQELNAALAFLATLLVTVAAFKLGEAIRRRRCAAAVTTDRQVNRTVSLSLPPDTERADTD